MVIVYVVLTLDVGIEISADQVPIVVVGESGNQFEKNVTLTKFTLANRLDYFLKARGQVFFGRSDRHPVFEFVHLLNSCSEDKNVLFFDFLIDLDVRSIHRTDNKTAIQHELHVTCP